MKHRLDSIKPHILNALKEEITCISIRRKHVAILLVLLLIGLSNLFFSSFRLVSEFNQDNAVSLYPDSVIWFREVERLETGEYLVYGVDPRFRVEPPNQVISSTRVVFRNPVKSNQSVQVYYAIENENLSERNSVTVFMPSGAYEVVLDLPSDIYGSLRYDVDIFNEPFEIVGIYVSESPLQMSRKWIVSTEGILIHLIICLLIILVWFFAVCTGIISKLPGFVWVCFFVFTTLFIYYNYNDVMPIANQGGNQFITGAYWFFTIFTAMSFLLTAYLLYIKNINLEKAFLVVASLIGFVYLFLTFNSTPDGVTHFRMSYGYSNVILFQALHSIRSADLELGTLQFNWHVNFESYRALYSSLFDRVSSREVIDYTLDLNNDLTPWMYFPPALGIAVARLLGFSTTMLYFSAGLFNLIFFIIGTYFAIKIIPFGKMALFCIALFPTTMNQAASSSLDNALNVITFLFIALALNLGDKSIKSEKIHVKEGILLCVLLAFIAPSKGGVYLPLTGLLLIILLATGYKHIPRFHKYLFISAMAAALTSFLFMSIQNSLAGVFLETNLDTRTLSSVLLNPVETLFVAINTLVTLGEFLLLQAVGIGMAWPRYVLPRNHSTILFAFLLITILSVQNIALTKSLRAIIGIVAGTSIGFTFLGALLTWTPYGFRFVAGMQGRYFTPILPLVFLLFAGIPWIQIKKDISKGIIMSLFLLQIFTMLIYFVEIIVL